MVRKVCGVGVNDASYNVTSLVEGRVVMCPFYQKWTAMLSRCYSKAYQTRNPTYAACSVCEDWHVFSVFRQWMAQQDWEGKELDKDILMPGNRVYSPEACVFVNKQINYFLLDSRAARGGYPIGVSYIPRRKKFIAKCSNPFSGRQETLGFFNSAEAAHQAWKLKKHEVACYLADLQEDSRIADALRRRYLSEEVSYA